MRNNYWIEAYAVYLILLEYITGSNHNELNWSEEIRDSVVLEIGIPKEKFENILIDLIREELIISERNILRSDILGEQFKWISVNRLNDRKRKIGFPTGKPIITKVDPTKPKVKWMSKPHNRLTWVRDYTLPDIKI